MRSLFARECSFVSLQKTAAQQRLILTGREPPVRLGGLYTCMTRFRAYIDRVAYSGALLMLAAFLCFASVADAALPGAVCPADYAETLSGVQADHQPHASPADEVPSETETDEEEAIAADQSDASKQYRWLMPARANRTAPASGAAPEEPFPERA